MMKLCRTCRYGSEYELDKPCIVYREDCPLYEKEGDGMTNNCDLISRQAVLDILEKEGHKWGNDYRDWVDAIEEIKKLPHVNPQEPKTGHWKKIQSGDKDFPESIVCSRCGHENSYLDFGISSVPIGKSFKKSKYCPNCGAKMVEPQESDHKCHTCKHYTSGKYDGSCDSYICEHYSGWESEG